MEKTTFSCLTKHCSWEGSFDQLDAHKQTCLETKEPCSFGCGEDIPRFQLDDHQTVCRKRPYKEGCLDASYETISEIKQLRSECQNALEGTSLERESEKHLYQRLITLFPLIVDAALGEHEPVTQPAGATPQTVCTYQCGFIATSFQELSLHNCPNVPLQCRHCKDHFLTKEIGVHEPKCDERIISCEFCGDNTKQGLLALHFKSCIKQPINCIQCQRPVPLRELEQHQESLCPSRAANCERCFTPVVFSGLERHIQNCWLTKPITLREGQPRPVILTPQPRSVGPFYQHGNSSSTIYMVTTHEQLKPLFKLNGRPVFPADMVLKCAYDGEPATIQESYATPSNELNWTLYLRHCTPEKVIPSRIDILDSDFNVICSFHPYNYPKLSDIMINSIDLNQGTAALDVNSILRLQRWSHPNPLRIIRFTVCPDKPTKKKTPRR
ncbi:hypothetical protein [Parendozoicomonas haliclonae]|uniref:hypothetical protein n=1 Tax=Parendozoicomonas haliclonae TaxID=1960125 RepID=UPI00105575C3|nr:hypothetical protein [Parendozoicomonas haliclonae]